ncbi:tetratricopeptide repeat protein [Lampropedia aestuarii]|nr:tetratricopeptide repeat protein [Lampropedia aestuarii]
MRQQFKLSMAARLMALVVGACAVYGSGAAWADQVVVDEISGLLEQGRLEQAAKRADAYVKSNPGDVQVRFLQGVIATEQGSNAKAIDIFTAISREYPQLPEPFNNLAVLYAAQGEERKAVEVLESAIRTNPSYATAHENLGDLYARMASEAYTKALQLDDSRKALQPKLSMITQIVPLQDGAGAARTNEAVQVAQMPAQAQTPAHLRQTQAREAAQEEQQRLAQQKQEQEQARQLRLEAEQAAQRQLADKAAADKAAADKAAADKVATEKALAEKAAAEQAALAQATADKAAAEQAAADKLVAQQRLDDAKKAAEPAKAEPSAPQAQAATKPAERPANSTASAVADINAVVKAWTTAWEAQDMPAYFAVYSADFKPADGSTVAQWKAQRTERTVGRPKITVQLRNLKVTGVSNDAATVRFHQTYTAGGFRAATQKTLTMKKEGGQWRIASERTGG